jgi:hypothetical protein
MSTRRFASWPEVNGYKVVLENDERLNSGAKGTVRAAATSNVSVTSAPATLDGITPTNGDVFLLTAQSAGSENGPRVWTAAGAAMNRATNWDTAGEAAVGSYWVVREGTNADRLALLTNDTFTLGTTTGTFSFIGAPPAPFEQDIGDASSVSFTLTHNFGTRAVCVHVYRNSSPWDEIDVYNERTSTNVVTIKPDVTFASNEFHAVVRKM